MRRLILTLLGAVALAVTLAVPASAGSVHGAIATGNSQTTRSCSTVHWAVTDVSNQAMITNWNNPADRCGLQQSAVAKCIQRGHYHNFDGPWRNTARTSEANCGTGYDIFCGGIRFRKGTSGPENTEWVWPNGDCDTSQPLALTYYHGRPQHHTVLLRTQRLDCLFFFVSSFNDKFEPIWAQSRRTSRTTCQHYQQRSMLHWCLRGVCGGGWNYGPWRTSTSSESRATASSDKAAFDRSYIQVRAKPGAYAACWRTGPTFGKGFFHCGNTP